MKKEGLKHTIKKLLSEKDELVDGIAKTEQNLSYLKLKGAKVDAQIEATLI